MEAREGGWGAQARDQAKLADELEQTNWGLFFLFSLTYILEGLITGFISTMPYVYPSLPDVDTMALFSATTLPFAFKFVLGTYMGRQPPSWRNSPQSSSESANCT